MCVAGEVCPHFVAKLLFLFHFSKRIDIFCIKGMYVHWRCGHWRCGRLKGLNIIK